MSSSADLPDSDEAVLAQFLLDLENHGPGILAEYARRHPADLVARLRDIMAQQQRLHDALREAAHEPIPDRLGDCKIVRRIGQGGMGEVYEAEQESLQRRVVVKVIRSGSGSSG